MRRRCPTCYRVAECVNPKTGKWCETHRSRLREVQDDGRRDLVVDQNKVVPPIRRLVISTAFEQGKSR